VLDLFDQAVAAEKGLEDVILIPRAHCAPELRAPERGRDPLSFVFDKKQHVS